MLQWVAGRIRRLRMSTIKPFGPDGSSALLRLTLCDPNPDVAQALAEAFAACDDVEVAEGSLFDLDCDTLVSPANSFGDMGGGVDQLIDRFYGGRAQPRVVEAIASQFFGELPVGVAIVLPMPTRRFPFLIVSPTMRVPGGVRGTINAYLSMRAALVAPLRHNRETDRPIRSIALPGLCTGVGGMPFTEAAAQMRAAYDNVLGGGWRKVVHPALAPYPLGAAGTGGG